MSEKALYSVGRTADGYRVIKWDRMLLAPEAVYHLLVTRYSTQCSCPRGLRHPTCRHRVMVREFEKRHLVGSGWMYCYDTNDWITPVNDL